MGSRGKKKRIISVSHLRRCTSLHRWPNIFPWKKLVPGEQKDERNCKILPARSKKLNTTGASKGELISISIDSHPACFETMSPKGTLKETRKAHTQRKPKLGSKLNTQEFQSRVKPHTKGANVEVFLLLHLCLQAQVRLT